MSLIKRGLYWHYDFVYRKVRYQGSSGQTNLNKARLVESKLRSDAALRHRGLLPPEDAPNFKEFLETRFLPHIRRQHAPKPNTVKSYEANIKRLLAYKPFVKATLDKIDGAMISGYIDVRAAKLKNASVNAELATLRKALVLAVDWGLIVKRPRISMLPTGPSRDFVLTGELENAYLAAAPYPLREAAILMLDLGFRVGEVVALRQSDCTDEGIVVQRGKSEKARRMLSHTARTKGVVGKLRELWGEQEWLFPGKIEGRHLTAKALENAHVSLRRKHGLPEDFVIHSFRHTAATRMAEAGASPFELMEFLGHSDIRMSSRYIHPSADSVSRAMARAEAFSKMLRGEGSHELKTGPGSLSVRPQD